MKKNKRLIFLIVFVFGFLVWNYISSSSNESKKKELFYSSLAQSKSIDIRYDSVVSKLFLKTIELMELDYEINLNKKYIPEKLNIYVLNFDSIAENSVQNLGLFKKEDLINLSKDNFVAIPPDIILIDGYYLSFLMLDGQNELMSYFQMIDEIEAEELNGDTLKLQELFSTRTSISTYLRINNYDVYKSTGEKPIAIDSIASYMSDLGMFEPYYAFLLPIISHELGHIKFNSQGVHGWIDFKSSIKKMTSIYKEEEKADSLGIATIAKFLEQEEEKNGNASFYVPQLINFCKTMRDVVLVETYQDFRNIEPQNFIVTLEQKSPMPEEFLDLPFNYVERVTKGYENSPPPMSKREFNDFLKKLNGSGSSIAHRHMFQRCQDILNLLEDKYGFHVNYLDSYLDLLSILEETDENTKELFIRDDLGELDISKEKVTYLLEQMLRFEEAINYENNKTEIGYFKNNLGYLELIGNPDNLNTVNLIMSTRNANGEMDMEVTIENIAIFIRFILNFFEDEEKGNLVAQKIFSVLREKEGHYPTFSEESEKYIFKITPMNESFFFKVNVQKK